MKKLFTILLSFFLLNCGFSQTADQGLYSPYGGVFTPKGDLRVLIIYAGFGNSGGSGGQDLADWPDDADQNSLPSYVDPFSGKASDLIYSENEKFQSLKQQNILNISRLYHEMSLGTFRMVGDVLKDKKTGKPVRINIDPTASNPDFPRPATSWGDCNYRVLLKMKERYPDFDWSPYDNRKNDPRYRFDNSKTVADGKPDYIIIIYRHGVSWKIQPVRGMNRWYGSGGGYSALNGVPPSFEYNGYHFDHSGFTQPEGKGNASQILKFFEHEIAHELYACPHVMGANGAAGDHFSFCASGYGMMSSWDKLNKTANGWERWVLGWIELTTGKEQVSSDLQTVSDLNADGNYVLRDFVKTGDVVRIKLPNVEDQYLWIENHQKRSIFDECPWANRDVSKDGEVVPPMSKGLFMYVESVLGDRKAITKGMTGDTRKVNGIKMLNAQGNFDYSHSDKAPKPSWDYFWKNTMYIFKRGKSNPISGVNPFQSVPDDYPAQATVGGRGDGKIKHSNYFNGGGNEVQKIIRESNGRDTNLILGHLGGVNREAREKFDRRSPTFQVGDELGLSGIQPVLNHPLYRKRTKKLDPYVLNGVKVEVIDEDKAGNITIRVRFDDFNVGTSTRWCGEIHLPAHPFLKLPNGSRSSRIKKRKQLNAMERQPMNIRQPMEKPMPMEKPAVDKPAFSMARSSTITPGLYSLNIKSGVRVLLDKSGIANRQTPTADGDFITPTKFTCLKGAYLHLDKGSVLDITEGSTFVLKAGSKLELEDGAQVIVRKGARLVLEDGAELIVKSGGHLDIAKSGEFFFANKGPNKGLSLESGGKNHPIRIAGVLEVAQTANFSIQGKGKVFLKSGSKVEMGEEAKTSVLKEGKRNQLWSSPATSE